MLQAHCDVFSPAMLVPFDAVMFLVDVNDVSWRIGLSDGDIDVHITKR